MLMEKELDLELLERKISIKKLYNNTTIIGYKLFTNIFLLCVKDAHTDDFVIPFDTSYTKISCDSTGSF